MTITKESLKSYHTKQLLNVLRKCCVNQQQLDVWYGRENLDEDYAATPEFQEFLKNRNKPTFEQTHLVGAECFGCDSNDKCTVTIAELKQELSLREHVMNKIEAKELRREKAKAKKNR